jgi:hypothetical protein
MPAPPSRGSSGPEGIAVLTGGGAGETGVLVPGIKNWLGSLPSGDSGCAAICPGA